MAVVSVDVIPGSRSGGIDRDFARTYAVQYRVLTDDPLDGAQVVLLGCGIFIGTQYQVGNDDDVLAGCLSLKAEEDTAADDARQWIVTAEYGPDAPAEEDPLDEPAQITWGSVKVERIVDVDFDGNAVVNTAGDYFDPPITAEKSNPTLTIVRNEETYSEALAYDFMDTINDAKFFGADPHCCKCDTIVGRNAEHPTFGPYAVVTYNFIFKPEDGWDAHPLNQGLRRLTTTGARAQVFIDGAPAGSPVLLDDVGQVLAVGDDPFYLDFQVYPERDFSAFGFPGAEPEEEGGEGEG